MPAHGKLSRLSLAARRLSRFCGDDPSGGCVSVVDGRNQSDVAFHIAPLRLDATAKTCKPWAIPLSSARAALTRAGA